MSAPTTAEVRERIDRIDRMRRAQGMTREAAAADHALRTVALPLAEHRDALAAEVARLRDALATIVHDVSPLPQVERRDQHADECEYRGSTLAAVDDCDCGLVVIAEVHKVASAALAAKGAGR